LLVRSFRVLAALVISLALVGCSGSQGSAEPDWRPLQTEVAQGAGIVLTLELSTASAEHGTRVRAVCSIESTRAVELHLQDGGEVHVTAVHPDSGVVEVDTLDAMREALADVPKEARPSGSVTLSGAGSRSGQTYEFTLDKPGRYSISASTFGPVVSTTPIYLEVK
jgi:hypothetical protein